MGIIWTVIVGFAVGVIAKMLHPGKENMGFIVTVLLGIAGSFCAGMLGHICIGIKPEKARVLSRRY